MKNRKMKKTLKWLIFIAYIAALVYFMFFAEILGRTDVSRTYRYNLVPFKEIKRFVNHFWQLGLTAVLANIAGNVVAFMLYTFGLSLAIELIQLVSKVGSFDVDDLMLNTLGGVLGYLTFLCYKKMCQFHRKRKKS